MSAGEVLNERETLEGMMSMLVAFQLDDSSGDEEDEDLSLLAAATVAHLEDARIDRTVIKSCVERFSCFLTTSTRLSVGRLLVPAKEREQNINILSPKFNFD